MTRHVLLSVLLCSMVGLSAPERVARADEPSAQAEGRAHFRSGVDFFKDGDYRAAMIEFKRAYELAPNYKVLYNLGQTSLELQDYAFALRSFERYLADGGREILAARRAKIEGEIEKLRRRVARVEVTTNVPDAEVFVDDVSVGRTPLPAPLAIGAGRRKISAVKSGGTTVRIIDVVGGDSTTLSLEIVEPTSGPSAGTIALLPPQPPEATRPLAVAPESPRAPPSAPSIPVPTHEVSPEKTGLSIGITATGALGAGAVATGILALSAKKDFDNTIARYGVDAQAVSDARSKTRTLALVTDVLAGATVLAGGITVIVAVRGGSSSKERARAMHVDVTPGGLVAAGTF